MSYSRHSLLKASLNTYDFELQLIVEAICLNSGKDRCHFIAAGEPVAFLQNRAGRSRKVWLVWFWFASFPRTKKAAATAIYYLFMQNTFWCPFFSLMFTLIFSQCNFSFSLFWNNCTEPRTHKYIHTHTPLCQTQKCFICNNQNEH